MPSIKAMDSILSMLKKFENEILLYVEDDNFLMPWQLSSASLAIFRFLENEVIQKRKRIIIWVYVKQVSEYIIAD